MGMRGEQPVAAARALGQTPPLDALTWQSHWLVPTVT